MCVVGGGAGGGPLEKLMSRATPGSVTSAVRCAWWSGRTFTFREAHVEGHIVGLRMHLDALILYEADDVVLVGHLQSHTSMR